MGFSSQQELFILDYFSHNSSKVLFLVDGWDEAGVDCLLQEYSVLNKILLGELFSESAVIIKSRPAVNAYHLLEKCYNRYSLVGFNDRRLRELFKQRLSQLQASRLFDTLSQSSHLHIKAAVQNTPLFATMIIELYKNQEALPSTITALYQLLLESIQWRYTRWATETEDSKSGMMTLSDRPSESDFEEVEKRLSSLALAGLINKRITITYDEVLCCGKNMIKSIFGLLSQERTVGKHGKIVYHFNHLAWQEYLGARCLAMDPDFIGKLSMCVSIMGVEEHTHMFWRFVAGLLSSRLLPDLMFELMKASCVSGCAPWETEVRLFLLECIAENIRVSQLLNDVPEPDVFIGLAAGIASIRSGSIVLNGCI